MNIKKWDQFVNESNNINKPITIKSKKNELFYINIFFDEEGRVDKIENKWDVKIPDWYGLNVNEIEINNWIIRKEPDLYIDKNINENNNNLNNNWVIIQKGTQLPDDFVKGGILNRDKYIIEFGYSDLNKWFDEFSSPVTAEIIGAIIIGSNNYNDFRYRIRTENDDRWDLSKTTMGKIINNSIKNDKNINENKEIKLSKEDIIKGNVIIADYLGLRYKNSNMYYIEEHEYPSADSFFDNATDCIYHKENLLYHYSWDWLEPVIDQLEEKFSIKFERDNIKKTWLDVVNYIKQKTQLTNENNSKIAFDEEIEYELKRYLEGTIWNKVGQIEKRTKELINLHRKFIDLAKNKMSANDIAKKLYEYEKNILDRK